MRAFVTGAGGFVGGHLVRALRERGDFVMATSLHAGPGIGALDVRDSEAGHALLDQARPDVIFHLAGQASVRMAIDRPFETYELNVMGTAGILEAIRRHGEPVRLILASSAEVYGVGREEEMPLRESIVPRPGSDYGAAKVGAEAAVLAAWRTRKIPTIVARTFNQLGPGQSGNFMLPSWALQLARIARGAEPKLLVGDVDVLRDLIDVRDAVQAYIALAELGKPGEIYNVARGTGVVLRAILDELIACSGCAVTVEHDVARDRPTDAPVLVADVSKLETATGWRPIIPLAQSVEDAWADALERVEAESATAEAQSADSTAVPARPSHG